MRISLVLGAAAALSAISGLAHGQANSQPGVVTSGAAGVTINGKPAVVMGDRTHCGGKTTSGSHGVFINGKPMVREGDQTSGCPQ